MQRLLIWGTGSYAEKLRGQIPGDTHEIVAHVDSDPGRQGGEFHGRPVIAPEQAAVMSPGRDYDQLVIASAFYYDIVESIYALGIPPSAVSSYWNFRDYAFQLTDEQLRILGNVPVWYHTFEILPGVYTPGRTYWRPYLMDYPEVLDLTGLRALDIGAWDGMYTLGLSRRGAEVTGFDIQPSTRTGFQAMCQVNGLPIRHICASVHDLNPRDHGVYDIVTFFGVYYHLRNPLAALANINAVLNAGGIMLVEGAILEGAPKVDAAWADRAEFVASMRDTPMACYFKGEYESNWSNWWVPNLACLKDWIESSGFEILHCKIIEDGTRAALAARKVREVPPEHFVMPEFA